MKKILFLSPDVIQGGIINNVKEKSNLEIITYLNLNYINKDKLLRQSRLNSIDPFLIFTKLGFQIGGTRFYFGLKKKFKEINPEIVVVLDFYRFHFWQAMCLKPKNTKLVLCSETKNYPKNPISKIILWFYIQLLKIFKSKVDKIITYNSDAKRFLEKRINGKKIYVVPAPIYSKEFKFKRNKSFFNNDKLEILIIARMVGFKRYDLLLKTLSKIKTEKKLKFNLTIVGNGPQEKKIKKWIKKFDLEEEVKILAPTNKKNLNKIYSNADVFILPSHNEAIGRVIGEAMSCGIPTITSSTVGANEYVINNKTGYIFQDGNYIDLKNKILKIANKDTLNKLSKEAIKQSKKFNPKDIAKQYINTIKK
ncbi:MAG: glycosyltransferase [Candidatus Woesearchaeota archaeon]